MGEYVKGEWLFDEMLKRQKQNNEAVANRYFSYARIDENQNSSKQNTLRDNKGRPVRIYEEKEDCFLQIKSYRYLENYEKIYNEAKRAGKLFEWYEGKWY